MLSRNNCFNLIPNMASKPVSLKLYPKIVIIGAGAAGIACAVKLLDAGFTNIKILEAENRIGGRIHSVPLDKSIVDLGAQWCHGEKDNIVYELVKDKDLLKTSKCTYRDNLFYNSSGQQIDMDLTNELFGIAVNIMNDLHQHKTSVGHFFIKQYIHNLVCEYSNNESCKNIGIEFLDWFHKLLLCYDAAPTWFDISTLGLAQYKECDGDPLLNWKESGYAKFFDVLMKHHNVLLKKKLVQLNKSVKIIVWSDDTNMSSVIHCQDESFCIADHTIITVSVGVLKEKHRNLFIPDLPPSKVIAIETQGFGTVNKILLKFESKWWSDETSFCFLWKEVDRMNILNEFPYGPMRDGRSWLEDISGFFVIDSDPTVLLGWLVGKFAPDVEELNTDTIERGCIFLLQKFLGHTYKIPKPKSVLVWYSNPNFRGSYSYRSVQSKETIAKDLAKPILNSKGKPILQFAGEATHPYYFSTVHGAVESGFREADRIIEYYRASNQGLVQGEAIQLISKI